MIYQFTEKYF